MQIRLRFLLTQAFRLKTDLIASVGDYILLDEQGNVQTMDESTFSQLYNPVSASERRPITRAKKGELTSAERILCAFSDARGLFLQDMSPAKLAEISGVDRHSVPPRLSDLRKKGLVTPNTADYRGNSLWTLTPEGVKEVRRLQERSAAQS
jgi:DNA-binding MarR family transcriptional regulator